jgi:transposase
MVEKKPAEKKSTEKKTAEKKLPRDVNKSEEIRTVARAMQAKGEKPRPVTIIATLKKQGVEVSSPQVSMVLKRMGFRPRKRSKTSAGAPATGARPKMAARVKGGPLSVDDLIAAKRLVGHFGGTDRALAAIEALQKFES